MEGISVIVCGYNSAARLPATLRHIAGQAAVDFDWEVIVVDNNSTDGMAEVAAAEWKRLGSAIPFRVVQEPQPGVAFARQAGVAASRYDLIVYCDDDNWLSENYVGTAFELMQDETIGVIGGLNVAVADAALPPWFKAFETAYACGPQGDHDGDIPTGHLYITCAGMVTRKIIYQTLADLNFKSLLTGRKGDALTSGEDTEFSIAAALLGYRLVYSSRLVLQHYMTPQRLTWEYFLRLVKGHAQSDYLLNLYKRLYERGKLDTGWLSYFQLAARVRDRLYHLRRALRWWWMYARKSQSTVGDAAAVEAFVNVETWKMHLRSYAEYATFVNELNQMGQWLRQHRIRPAAAPRPLSSNTTATIDPARPGQ